MTTKAATSLNTMLLRGEVSITISLIEGDTYHADVHIINKGVPGKKAFDFTAPGYRNKGVEEIVRSKEYTDGYGECFRV